MVLYTKSDASAAASSSDPLEALLSQLGTGLESAGDSDEELQGMLETMMQQLMSKEVLYEPLKELHDKVRCPSPIQTFIAWRSLAFSFYASSISY